MDKSTSLLSASHLLQQVFKLHSSPFFHVVHPSIESVFLIFCSRCSSLHEFFHQKIFFFSYHVSKVRQSSSFLITCPKYDNFLLLIMLCSLRSIPAVSKIPIRLFSSVSTIPLESFVCISSQKL